MRVQSQEDLQGLEEMWMGEAGVDSVWASHERLSHGLLGGLRAAAHGTAEGLGVTGQSSDRWKDKAKECTNIEREHDMGIV